MLAVSDPQLPILPKRIDQIAESILSFPERLAHTVLNQSAFQIDRLLGRWRQFYAGCVLEHPADLLKVLPGAFA